MAQAVLLDSSTWIEIFNCGPLQRKCEKYLQGAAVVIVPTVVLFEVYKKIRLKVSEDQALQVVSYISKYDVRDLSREIALTAADISVVEKLPMADSIVLAHAREAEALLVTLDHDFSQTVGVVVVH